MSKLKIAFIGAGSRSFAGRTLGDILLSDPLNEFELGHREAMMDTRSLELSQRIMVSESVRLYGEEAREAPTEAQVCARDGRGGGGERRGFPH